MIETGEQTTPETLRQRLAAYPLESHPVEHATIQFNLGLAIAESPEGASRESLEEAIAAHAAALTVFDEQTYPLLRGRVLTALGAVERDLGMQRIARDRFAQAEQVLADLEAPAETGAARNNLGLSETDLGNFTAAIDAFDRALECFESGTYDRQRATALINRGMARSRLGTIQQIEAAIDDYRSASKLVQPDSAAYVYALAHHSLGVALLGVPNDRERTLAEAIRSLDTSLSVFTRTAYPFQHALTKNNLGVAYEEIAPHDPTSQRRAMARFEEAMMLLDPRLHEEQWRETNANLVRVLSTLEAMVGQLSRVEHFAALLGAVSPPEQLDLLRFRLRSYLAMPEPHRSGAFLLLDEAITNLAKDQLVTVTRSWMEVWMEQPHEHLEIGLQSRQRAHGALEGARLQSALVATEAALGDLEIIQRMRVRDMLAALGYERPEPS